MWKFHLILALVLLLGIAGANADGRSNQLQYLMNLSMQEGDSKILIQACNKTNTPDHCIKYAGAIRTQEGGYGTKHPFGMLRQPSRYKGEKKEMKTSEYVELRVGSYTRYWTKNDTPSKWLTRSRYCTDGCQHRVPNVTRFISGYESGKIPQDIEPTGTPPAETIAYSEPIQTGCRWIGTAKEGERIQVDQHSVTGFLKILRAYIVGKDEKTMIFICDK